MPRVRLLWIGAHPDDELFVAPWLGSLIESEQVECGFLVATRGEKGDCFLPEGCLPDLATVREREMREAATIFGGKVWFADCRDGSSPRPKGVLREWANDAGGMPALLERFNAIIREFAPDRLVTFNRLHGCTWHADHRAIGMLVQRLALPIPVTLAESRLIFSEPFKVTPGVRNAKPFDSRATWDFLIRDLACHLSQFKPVVIELFRNAPPSERKIWLTHRGPWRRWHRYLAMLRRDPDRTSLYARVRRRLSRR